MDVGAVGVVSFIDQATHWSFALLAVGFVAWMGLAIWVDRKERET